MTELLIRFDGESVSEKKALKTIINFLENKPPYYFREYGLQIKRNPDENGTKIYTVIRKDLKNG